MCDNFHDKSVGYRRSFIWLLFNQGIITRNYFSYDFATRLSDDSLWFSKLGKELLSSLTMLDLVYEAIEVQSPYVRDIISQLNMTSLSILLAHELPYIRNCAHSFIKNDA